jgi:hypothetical protein
MKKNYTYNDLVRFYNRSLRKLNTLLSLGKNSYKQNILKRRIARLFQLLTGMQNSLKLKGATFAVAAGFVMFQPNAVNAQTFAPKQINPYGLVIAGTSWTTPAFVDLDGDGDKDILAGLSTGAFIYYPNNGTASAPAFGAPVANPFGLVGTGGGYSSTAFADYDNDGDLDFISGDVYGDFFYYENSGTSTAANFISPVNNPDGLSNLAAGYSFATFVDLDNDGDFDVMGGDKNGDFFYFMNTGTSSAASFGVPSVDPFGLTAEVAGYSTATFVDLDGDGDKDMFSSAGNSFDYYPNTGSASSPAFGTVMALPFSLTTIGSNNGATASFADLDNDGDLDMISGISTGDLIYYQNTTVLGIKNNVAFAGLNIFPNPTNGDVTMIFNNSNKELSIEVSNTLGQVVSTAKTNMSVNTISLPEAKGVYFVKLVNAANESSTFKIVKQ